ncbi:MAG: hypothetical protein IJ779_10970 [Ruminococcus sp.]|nr:hypothetical protein [Ruminococcus sp.]
MAVRKKGRRKITVDENEYIWYVSQDDESPYYLLSIVSENKDYVLTCPLKTEIPYLISKGKLFKTEKSDGTWHRYELPFDIPEIITPLFVAKVILWATQKGEAVLLKRKDGHSFPV